MRGDNCPWQNDNEKTPKGSNISNPRLSEAKPGGNSPKRIPTSERSNRPLSAKFKNKKLRSVTKSHNSELFLPISLLHVHEYLRSACGSFDLVREDYLNYHAGFALKPNLRNSSQELFPAALKQG